VDGLFSEVVGRGLEPVQVEAEKQKKGKGLEVPAKEGRKGGRALTKSGCDGVRASECDVDPWIADVSKEPSDGLCTTARVAAH